MVFPPFTQFELRTNLPVAAITALLRHHTGELSWKSGFEYHANKLFNARINGNKFTMRERPGGYRRNARPVTKGHIIEGAGDWRQIRITVRYSWLQMLVIALFLFLSMQGIVKLVLKLLQEPFSAGFAFFAILVLAFVVAGYVALFRSFRLHVEEIRKFLVEVLSTELVNA